MADQTRKVLAFIAGGIIALMIAAALNAPGKDQSRLNRVACEVGDIAVVDAVGNLVGCRTITPGSTFAKKG